MKFEELNLGRFPRSQKESGSEGGVGGVEPGRLILRQQPCAFVSGQSEWPGGVVGPRWAGVRVGRCLLVSGKRR